MISNKKKTYGVYGIIEMVAVIPCGKAKMNVPFSGGSQTAYGISPAIFTTEDPMKQVIIERSEMFKTGKIRLVRETEGTGKYNAIMNTAAKLPDTEKLPDADENPKCQNGECLDDEGLNTDEAMPNGIKVVEVSDIDVARDYMVENYNYTQTALRYKSNLLKAAEEHGVKFVTAEGPIA